MESFQMIAKTFQGLEEVLAQELTALGANDIEIGRRMVSFSGDKEMMYKANFCLRTAIRILKPIKGIPRHPILEDNVIVYSNATILGRITIGQGATVGGNIWVTEDVPAGARIVQTKAKK